jgi:hypothetical protein
VVQTSLPNAMPPAPRRKPAKLCVNSLGVLFSVVIRG